MAIKKVKTRGPSDIAATTPEEGIYHVLVVWPSGVEFGWVTTKARDGLMAAIKVAKFKNAKEQSCGNWQEDERFKTAVELDGNEGLYNIDAVVHYEEDDSDHEFDVWLSVALTREEAVLNYVNNIKPEEEGLVEETC